MNSITRPIAVAVLAVIVAASSTALAAGSDSAGKYSDQQLKEFVKAQNNVQAMLKKWEPKLAKAKDKNKNKEKLQNDENKALVKAIKSTGLTPKQYNNIAGAAQKDPKLTKRIQSFMTPQ